MLACTVLNSDTTSAALVGRRRLLPPLGLRYDGYETKHKHAFQPRSTNTKGARYKSATPYSLPPPPPRTPGVQCGIPCMATAALTPLTSDGL